MRRKHVRHLHVIDENRRLLGMIGSRDLVRVAAHVTSTLKTEDSKHYQCKRKELGVHPARI
jgi:CBS-domain-containing membrane protein